MSALNPKPVTVTVKVEWSDEHQIYFAYDASVSDMWDGKAIGEGSTPEDAKVDFWHGYNFPKRTASVWPPDAYEDCWHLFDGNNIVRFESREEAYEYGDKYGYLI